MKWFLSRMKEPSTWAGLAGLFPMIFAAAAGPLTPQVIGGLVAGTAAVLMKEKGASDA